MFHFFLVCPKILPPCASSNWAGHFAEIVLDLADMGISTNIGSKFSIMLIDSVDASHSGNYTRTLSHNGHENFIRGRETRCQIPSPRAFRSIFFRLDFFPAARFLYWWKTSVGQRQPVSRSRVFFFTFFFIYSLCNVVFCFVFFFCRVYGGTNVFFYFLLFPYAPPVHTLLNLLLWKLTWLKSINYNEKNPGKKRSFGLYPDVVSLWDL